MTHFMINGRAVAVDADADTPLLWVVREQLGLTGTKYGCGIAMCGACTVHVDGTAVRSCSFPLSAAAGRRITTIEGLSKDRSHAVQKAWIAEQVPQCGYCQSGMIMAVAALLEVNPNPGDAEIDAAITNICRCGTYQRIRQAVHRAAGLLGHRGRVGDRRLGKLEIGEVDRNQNLLEHEGGVLPGRTRTMAHSGMISPGAGTQVRGSL